MSLRVPTFQLLGVLLLCGVAGCNRAAAPRASEPISEPPVTRDEAFAASESTTQPAGTAVEEMYEGYNLVGGPQIVEALALIVDGDVITVNEVLQPVRSELRAAAVGGDAGAFLRDATRIIGEEIRRQVNTSLVIQQADRELSEPEKQFIEGQVQRRLREMIVEAGGSRSALEAEMLDRGMTLDAALARYRRQFTGQFFLHRRLMQRVHVTPRDVWMYYRNHPEDFVEPRQVTLQLLAAPYRSFTETAGNSSREQAVEHVELARGRVDAGEPFSEVVKDMAVTRAYRQADGGQWDFLTPGNFKEQVIEDFAFSADPGGVSGVLAGETGAFLVRVVEVKPERTISFEEAQADIENQLKEKQYAQLAEEYFTSLRERAVIEQGEAFEKLVLARARQIYFEGVAEEGAITRDQIYAPEPTGETPEPRKSRAKRGR